MRTIIGVIAVLGLAVTVAEAQPPRERGAAFRPPEPLKPSDLPAVARGAADEFLPSTPVTKATNRAPAGAGPEWLTGPDPNVRPAAGSVTKIGNVRPLTPPPTGLQSKEDPGLAAKALDRLKGTPPAPEKRVPTPEQPTAATPFRGTGASGAPVYAGPPAYRWYGWGTVTPGANPFAPTGQFPKASANWYSITGATPGAFPVPVMNPLRTPPGTEPPNYSSAPVPQPQPVASQPPPPFQPRPQPLERPETLRFNPPVESKFAPPAFTPPAVPVNVPKITPPPTVSPTAVAPGEPESVAVKELAPIPVLPPPVPAPVVALPVLPPAVPLPTPSVLPSVEPAKPVGATPPSPLPISVTDESKPAVPNRVEVTIGAPKREAQHWQTAPEPTQRAPGTWAPAGAPLPVHSNDATPAWKSGAAPVKPVVARAQIPDAEPDSVATLVRQVCQGRADGVDVRWSGTKKLMVCFEVRAAAEAQKLVTDISRRPELAPYQIDFCVVVK